MLNISTVSYLPKNSITEVRKSQTLISKKFSTTKSLSWTPHITIADRVLMPQNKFNKICRELRNICAKTKPIKVKTKEIEFVKLSKSPFENPYIIFIKVEVDKELQKIHDFIQDNIYKGLVRPSYKSKKYAPHITLAYRDLTKKNFEKAKEYFKKKPINAKYSFALDNIHLISHLPNEVKNSIKTIKFGK